MLDMRKILLSCVCSVALLVSVADATNLITNGGFNGSGTGWIWLPLSTATGSAAGFYYASDGNPAGSAVLQNVDPNITTGTTNFRYYQAFAVTPGNTYYLRADWKGDIVGLVTDTTSSGTLRNYAEVFVTFSASAPPYAYDAWPAGTAASYKKAYGDGLTNTTTGTWGWESILASPDGGGPANGAFTVPAGMTYMVLSFSIGGRALSVDTTASLFAPGSVWYMVDNIRVCNGVYTGDLNDDCNVDFKDLASMAGKWLYCGMNHANLCW
jgi:hypothetical protein